MISQRFSDKYRFYLKGFGEVVNYLLTLICVSFTIVPKTIRTEMIGRNADTKITVYKWISGNDNGDGTFSNIVDQIVTWDDNIGNSNITVNPTQSTVYAIKVESRIGASGVGTEYKLIIE